MFRIIEIFMIQVLYWLIDKSFFLLNVIHPLPEFDRKVSKDYIYTNESIVRLL